MTDQELAAIRDTYDRPDAPVKDLYRDARRLLAEVDRLRAIETAAVAWADAIEDPQFDGQFYPLEQALLAAVRGDDTDPPVDISWEAQRARQAGDDTGRTDGCVNCGKPMSEHGPLANCWDTGRTIYDGQNDEERERDC